MDDMQSKTDAELDSIMQSAVSNQHVPGSMYHRARLELERRSRSPKLLSDTAKAVLAETEKSKMGNNVLGKLITIPILEHRFGEKRLVKLHAALDELMERDYLEEYENDDEVLRLTPFGEAYLSDQHRVGGVSYNNISNANIAHDSPNSVQTINITDYSQDIQDSFNELREATAKRDSSGIKKAFGYIADKAVDLAIAILAGHIKL